MPQGAFLISDFDGLSQLRGLAEHIHRAAEDMPLTDARHSVSDNLDELEDRLRDITRLIVHVTGAAAVADREVSSHTGTQAETTRRRATALTNTVRTLGRALADLTEAVADAGLLHHDAALSRTPGRTREATRSALEGRLNSARRQLNEAGRQLQLDAHQLTPPAITWAPAATPTAPRPTAPAPSSPRTR